MYKKISLIIHSGSENILGVQPARYSATTRPLISILRTRFNKQAIFSPVLRGIVATAALLGTAVAPCYSDAIVGDVRKVAIPKAESASDTEIRASYKRPTTIPFPADNPVYGSKGHPREETLFRLAPLGRQAAVMFIVP
jgi:hypothetical protein